MDARTSDTVDTHAQSNGHAHHTHSQDHHHDHDAHVHSHSSDSPKQNQSDPRTSSPALIITLSPHVRSSLPDADVLALTQWAGSRVRGAFAKGDLDEGGVLADVEVTVGVVRA